MLDAAGWARVSPLLDQGLDLEPGARAAWLAGLDEQQPELAATLRRLLAAHDEAAAGDALERASPWRGLQGVLTLAPGARVGPYRLLRLLGSGGMADVWLAAREDAAPARQVALKLPLLPRLRPDLVQRFARERDILARLEHPGIARLYDAGLSAEGLPYLALEHVDGRPLNAWCDEQHLDVAARLRLLLDVADAVQYAHSRLVIHRDLKPSNILVDSAGRVRLLDFGIAKLLQDDRAAETAITQHAGRALTLDYASPEQVRGEPLTTASDQYSLGVLAFELLAGARPYRLKRGSAAELEEAIAEAEPPPPSQAAADPELRAALRGNLDAIIGKSLAKLPAARYATVSEWAEDIKRHLAGRATVARPDTRRRAALRWMLRRRAPLAATAAAVLALVLGVGLGAAALVIAVLAAALLVAALLARQARQHRLRAEADAERAAAIRDFMLTVFHVGDAAAPGGRRPGDVTLKEALDIARARLAGGVLPRGSHALLGALAGVYEILDEPQANFELLRMALRAQRIDAPDDLRGRAQLLARLAQAAFFHGLQDEVGSSIDELEATLARLHPPDEATTASALYLRARWLAHLGRPTVELLALLERCEQIYARIAPLAPERVHALGRLVQAYAAEDRLADAARVANVALVCAEAATGIEPIGVPNAYSVRGLMRLEAGDSAGGRADLAAAAAGYRDVLGEDHFLTQQNDTLLGHAEVAEGDIEAGLARAGRAAQALQRSRPGHATLARALERAALAQLQAGRPADAEPLLNDALSVWSGLPPDQAAHGARTQVALARAKRLNGDLPGARQLLLALQATTQSGAGARKTVQRELRSELQAAGLAAPP